MTVPVNFSGIASGIDTNSIITKLLQVEGIGVRRLQAQQKATEAKKTAFGTLETKLKTLGTKTAALQLSTNFDARTTSVTDESVLSATASTGAATGTYDVTIVQRAKSTRVVGADPVSDGNKLDLSKKLNDAANHLATAVSGSGADPNVGRFQITNGVNTATISYDLSADSLQDVITRINASDAGVTASYDSLSDRMLITSNAGGNTAMTIENLAGEGNLASAFKLDAASSAQTVLGQYAQIKIEGLNLDDSGVAQIIQSTDNVFTSTETGLTGLSFTAKVDSGTASVTVDSDVSGIKTRFEDFISAYNDVVQYIASQSTTGTGEDSKAGPFTGDSSILSLSRQLRDLTASTVAGLPEDINYLRGIGIGTVSTAPDLSLIDSERLTDVIRNHADDLKTLMTNTTDGIMTRLDSYLDNELTGSSGLVTTKNENFTSQLDRISDDIESENERLESYELRLRQQYAAMEKTIAAAQGGLSMLLSSLPSVNQ